jgi:hypothetical protein
MCQNRKFWLACWRFLADKLTGLEPELHGSGERLHRKRDPGRPW